MIVLPGLMETSPDADLLRETVGFAAQRRMELEVGGLTGAGHAEKSPERRVQRNGYRDRDWETRAGTVELRIPKLCKGSYFTFLVEPHRLAGRLDEAEADALAYMSFPALHRPKLHSANPLERVSGEIKRPTEVVGISPDEAAIVRRGSAPSCSSRTTSGASNEPAP